MKYVLLYESSPEARARAAEHFPAHRARWSTAHEAGDLLMIGPFADSAGGAMAVFTSREAAEAFAADDPFVIHGVVATWEIREWREALVPEGDQR
ncbi:MAG TPA: YciI family protein [Actinomycetota bacterium]|nr:YciI family protein [Actinomycetota bacterium]